MTKQFMKRWGLNFLKHMLVSLGCICTACFGIYVYIHTKNGVIFFTILGGLLFVICMVVAAYDKTKQDMRL